MLTYPRDVTEQAAHSRVPAFSGKAAGPGGPAVFLGRRDELSTLRGDTEHAGLHTLAGRPAPRSRVLLIVGRPGTGRTSLAEEYARRREAAGDFADGVLRARLTDPGGTPVPLERTARALLGDLGLVAPPGAEEDELTAELRAALAAREVLLLLDDVATADQLNELTPDSRVCLVVAVARGPLTGVPDVRPCTVGALGQNAAVQLITRGAGPTRVTVDPRAAESLAERCAHLPAALVLAGGWLAAHPDAAVADAARRLADLESAAPEGDALDRAFRLATSHLSATAARMLRLLALAPAGLADAHTAATLAGCSIGTARTTLAELALLGLVRTAHARPPGPEQPVGPLYAVPGCLEPLLRARLEERERPSDVQLARARMLERTVRQLMACHAATQPPDSDAREWLAGLPGSLRFADEATAAAWLAHRLDALQAASRLAVADGELDTLARRLIAALTAALLAHRGARVAAPELYRLHELVLGVAERQHLARERAAALLNLGDLDAANGRPTAALARYQSALAALRSEGDRADREAVGRVLESIGGTHAELGGWQRAADWYGRALTMAQSRDDRESEARLHGRLGAVLTYDEQWRPALRSWRAAAATHRRRGDTAAQARAVGEAGRVQEYAGWTQDALRTCREALRIAERTDDARLRAALWLRLADCAERLGHKRDADAHRAEADRLLGPPGETPAAARVPAPSAPPEAGTSTGVGVGAGVEEGAAADAVRAAGARNGPAGPDMREAAGREGEPAERPAAGDERPGAGASGAGSGTDEAGGGDAAGAGEVPPGESAAGRAGAADAGAVGEAVQPPGPPVPARPDFPPGGEAAERPAAGGSSPSETPGTTQSRTYET